APLPMLADDSSGDLGRRGEAGPARVELVQRDDAGAELIGDAVGDRRLARSTASVDEDPRARNASDGVEDATNRVVDDGRSKRQRRFFLRHLMMYPSARPATQTNGVSTARSVTMFGTKRNSLPRRTYAPT